MIVISMELSGKKLIRAFGFVQHVYTYLSTGIPFVVVEPLIEPFSRTFVRFTTLQGSHPKMLIKFQI